MKTFNIPAGQRWATDTAGQCAVTVKLHNESTSAVAQYSVTLGTLAAQGAIPAGGDASVGRWLPGGNELTIGNTSPVGGPTISGSVIGGMRLAPGWSGQVQTSASASVNLIVVNDSTRVAAQIKTWCGGKDSPIEQQTIPPGGMCEKAMPCDGKPINVTNITPPGVGAAVIVTSAVA